MSQLEIKVGLVKPDLHLNHVCTHKWIRVRFDRPEIPNSCPTSELNKSCLEIQAVCDAKNRGDFDKPTPVVLISRSGGHVR